MTNQSTIGACMLPRKRCVVLAATDGSANQLVTFDGALTSALLAWTGKEITTCCSTGEAVVCPALGNNLYLVEGNGMTTLHVPGQPAWIYGAATTGPTTILLGGRLGTLVSLDIAKQTVERWALADFGVTKPGRDILAVVNTGQRLFLLGKKCLLAEYVDGRVLELLGGTGRLPETFFLGAALLGRDLWITGLDGRTPALVKYSFETGRLEHYDLPGGSSRCPVIQTVGRDLLLGTGVVYRGLPGEWRAVFDLGEESLVALVPLPQDAAGAFCAVGLRGQAMRFIP